MDMSLGALWVSMSNAAKGIVIVMIIMSVYSIWVMIERFITFNQAKNQSLKLLGALSNVLTKGDYQQAIDITKKYKQSHLAKVISAGLLEFEAVRRDKRNTDPEVAIEASRQGMDRTAMITVAELKENLGALATIGATAPFVGLFGTVLGIIRPLRRHPGGLGVQLLPEPRRPLHGRDVELRLGDVHLLAEGSRHPWQLIGGIARWGSSVLPR